MFIEFHFNFHFLQSKIKSELVIILFNHYSLIINIKNNSYLFVIIFIK